MPVARVGETFAASCARLGCRPRPLLDAAYFDPDEGVRRFAFWSEVEATRLGIVTDGVVRGVGGVATMGNLVRADPRLLMAAPEVAGREWARALAELAALAVPFGFVVDATGTDLTAEALEQHTKGTHE